MLGHDTINIKSFNDLPKIHRSELLDATEIGKGAYGRSQSVIYLGSNPDVLSLIADPNISCRIVIKEFHEWNINAVNECLTVNGLEAKSGIFKQKVAKLVEEDGQEKIVIMSEIINYRDGLTSNLLNFLNHKLKNFFNVASKHHDQALLELFRRLIKNIYNELDHFHSYEVLHLDVALRNFVLSGSNLDLRLIDYGLAKILDPNVDIDGKKEFTFITQNALIPFSCYNRDVLTSHKKHLMGNVDVSTVELSVLTDLFMCKIAYIHLFGIMLGMRESEIFDLSCLVSEHKELNELSFAQKTIALKKAYSDDLILSNYCNNVYGHACVYNSNYPKSNLGEIIQQTIIVFHKYLTTMPASDAKNTFSYAIFDDNQLFSSCYSRYKQMAKSKITIPKKELHEFLLNQKVSNERQEKCFGYQVNFTEESMEVSDDKSQDELSSSYDNSLNNETEVNGYDAKPIIFEDEYDDLGDEEPSEENTNKEIKDIPLPLPSVINNNLTAIEVLPKKLSIFSIGKAANVVDEKYIRQTKSDSQNLSLVK